MMGRNHFTAARACAVGVALLVIAGGAPSAEGAPVHWSRAFAQANADGFFGQFDTGELMGVDTAGPATVTRTATSSATATASVIDGVLHSFASAAGPFGSTTALAQYSDTFVPVSATLAPGTPVDLLFDFVLTYSLGGDCPLNPGTVFGGVTLNGNVSAAGAARTFQDSTCDASDFTFSRGIVQAYIGQEFVMGTFLYAMAGSAGGASWADAGNTLRPTITLFGDFDLTSSSGNDFVVRPVPVPEPASALLIGIAAFAVRVSRRRRH